MNMLLGPTPASAQTNRQALADLSLEELSNLQITSVSKRPERLADAPASVFVITADELRRSGATTLPEALRLAPNLHVAQRSASQYSIGARGLNNTAGNKMLVLIDGRSVYTPLFSGVFWDVQDVVMEDVERIEVISGPGGTLWGVNAVNGVINIITRAAKDTQGTLAAVGGGNQGSGATIRHGAPLGEQGHVRVYGKYTDWRHSYREGGAPISDAWHKTQAGFRADWSREQDQLTIQGDVYNGSEAPAPPGTITLGGTVRVKTITLSGLNLLTRLDHHLGGGARLKVQAYYDHTVRDVPGIFEDRLDVIDLQLEHALQALDPHTLTWGAEYRYGMDEVINSTDYVAFLPSKVNQAWGSLFGQDKIALSEDLQLTLGARIETNPYTRTEFLPSARLAWKFHEDHMLWTAASRTARAPSRIDRDLYYPVPTYELFSGSPDFQSEVAKVYEIGYRGQPSAETSLSATVFHTVYDGLRTLELTPPGALPVFWANKMAGHTTGMEAWGTYQAASTWRLSAGFTLLHKNLRLVQNSYGLNGGIAAEGNDPDSSWNLRSTWNPSSRWEMDATVRHVDSLPQPPVPAYTVLDLRLGWKPRPGLELSVGGRNLLGSAHAEFYEAQYRSALRSGVYVKVLSRF